VAVLLAAALPSGWTAWLLTLWIGLLRTAWLLLLWIGLLRAVWLSMLVWLVGIRISIVGRLSSRDARSRHRQQH
jgi:hypothetical protein